MVELLSVAGQLLASTFRVSTPLILAALGGFVSERAGVIQIALEGIMLFGGFFAAAVTLKTGSPMLGAGAAATAGALVALFYGVAVIRWRADQIVAGTAINFLAMGGTPFLSKILYGSTGATPNLELSARFGSEPLALVAILLVGVAAWYRFSPGGLWLRVAGEHPDALETAGIRVTTVRWFALAFSGVFAGLGGAVLSIGLASAFTRNMTAGRGFMALAALIFGKWRPIPAALACLLFGFSDAIQIRLQGVVLWGTEPVPVQFIQILPYIATILVLAGFVGQSRAPRALGLPYPKA